MPQDWVPPAGAWVERAEAIMERQEWSAIVLHDPLPGRLDKGPRGLSRPVDRARLRVQLRLPARVRADRSGPAHAGAARTLHAEAGRRVAHTAVSAAMRAIEGLKLEPSSKRTDRAPVVRTSSPPACGTCGATTAARKSRTGTGSTSGSTQRCGAFSTLLSGMIAARPEVPARPRISSMVLVSQATLGVTPACHVPLDQPAVWSTRARAGPAERLRAPPSVPVRAPRQRTVASRHQQQRLLENGLELGVLEHRGRERDAEIQQALGQMPLDLVGGHLVHVQAHSRMPSAMNSLMIGGISRCTKDWTTPMLSSPRCSPSSSASAPQPASISSMLRFA